MKKRIVRYILFASQKRIEPMSLQVQRLSKEVLSSYTNTRTFLEGKSTLIEIAKQRDLFLNQPLFFTTKQVKRNRFWQIIDKCTHPIRIFLYTWLAFLSLPIALRFPSLGLRMYLLGKRIKRGFKDCHTTTNTHSYTIGSCNKETPQTTCLSAFFSDRLLNASLHLLALKPKNPANKVTLIGQTENYSQKNIPEVQSDQPIEVTDPKLQKQTSSHLKLSTKGICRGMSAWFVYLYLQTKHLYGDAQKHMLSLSKIFADGAPIEATLLQSVLNNGGIIDLNFGAPGFFDPNPVQTIALMESKGKRQIANPLLVEKELDNLKAGAYFCYFPNHAITFVKISSNLCYFFDPNAGILEFAGPQLGAELLAYLNDPWYLRDEAIHGYSSVVASATQYLPRCISESYKKNCPPCRRDREIHIYSLQLRDCALHIGPAPQQVG